MYSLKLRDGESMQDHVKAMIATFNEISVVGRAINGEDQVVHLLASLPESYSYW